MSLYHTVRRNLGGWVGRAAVLGMFVGIPAMVWWVAMPQIATLPLDGSYRGLMSSMVVASVGFGLVCAWLVWQDLANEP